MQAKLNLKLRVELAGTPVIPVLTVDDVAIAVALGTALVAGGLAVLEVTLRTPASLEALRRMATDVKGATVGAGTVLSDGQAKLAINAGARFLVSPGASLRLLDAAERWPVPLLPGLATASEAVELIDRGYAIAKFFPATAAGGIAYLKALAAPLPALAFCPTGGISAANAADYLACPNVVCVGGSWMAPADAVAAADWSRITALARTAAGLAKH